MAKHKKNRQADQEKYMNEPSPRFQYEGNVHPITGEQVFRTDAIGLIAAKKEIIRRFGNHTGLEYIDNELTKLQKRATAENNLHN